MNRNYLRVLRIAVLGLLVVLAVGFSWKLVYSVRMAHGVGDIVWSSVCFFVEETIYAPGYSEEGFDSVEVGNSMLEVLEVLGRPLVIVREGRAKKAVFIRVSETTWGRELQRIRDRAGYVNDRSQNEPRCGKPGEVWIFSEALPDHNFWKREVVFDSTGRVSAKHSSFFMD
jgi:hypothetical protein